MDAHGEPGRSASGRPRSKNEALDEAIVYLYCGLRRGRECARIAALPPVRISVGAKSGCWWLTVKDGWRFEAVGDDKDPAVVEEQHGKRRQSQPSAHTSIQSWAIHGRRWAVSFAACEVCAHRRNLAFSAHEPSLVSPLSLHTRNHLTWFQPKLVNPSNPPSLCLHAPVHQVGGCPRRADTYGIRRRLTARVRLALWSFSSAVAAKPTTPPRRPNVPPFSSSPLRLSV